MTCKQFFLVVTLGVISPLLLANENDFFQWQSSNIQLLRGADYELGSERRTVMTLEHANSFKYGDFFIFGDQIWSDEASSTYYIEPTLRLSLSKAFDAKIAYSNIKDVLISAQIEKPKNQDTRKLLGVGVDLNLPGFKFFKSNFFVRDNPNLSGSTYQVTLVWNIPFELNGTSLLLEGFTDIAGSEGTTVAHQLIVPRLLVDVGKLSGFKAKTLWLGIEWQYWHNKFGVDGITESVPQLQLKYIL